MGLHLENHMRVPCSQVPSFDYCIIIKVISVSIGDEAINFDDLYGRPKAPRKRCLLPSDAEKEQG
jgi:hypothetical protein